MTTEQRDLELEVDDLRQKLTTLEKKLYSGTVANPKELDAMTKEAQQFRGLISSREDRLIEIYENVEAATKEAAEIATRLESVRADLGERLTKLTAERHELRSAIAENDRRRAGLTTEADPNGLRSYESLRRTRAGLAVASVAQRTCQGCRISLPASEEIRARTSENLVFCQSCGRILYSGL